MNRCGPLFLVMLLVACGTPSSAGSPVISSSSAPTALAPDAAAVASPTSAAKTVRQIPPQLPASVTDKDGRSVTITAIDRIVSLNGDITEIIFALEMGQYLVGVDSSATYPPDRVGEIANIGYQRKLNAEGILSLKPTLVIGDEAAGPPEVLSQITAAGVPVALTRDPPTLDAPALKIRFVAQSLGVPQRGEALIKQLDADLASARKLLEGVTGPKRRVLFLYLRGANVQQVAGSDTAVDAMIQAAGAINAATEAGIRSFTPLSPEIVVTAQPDVLLVLTAGLESVGGEEGLLALPGLADTPAGKGRRVVAMDDLYLLGMGPRTGKALVELVAAFYPENGPGAIP